jgi:hypothetical protein
MGEDDNTPTAPGSTSDDEERRLVVLSQGELTLVLVGPHPLGA